MLNNRHRMTEQLCYLFSSTGFIKIYINTQRKYNGILIFSDYRASQKPIIYVANLEKRIARQPKCILERISVEEDYFYC